MKVATSEMLLFPWVAPLALQFQHSKHMNPAVAAT